MQFAHRFYEPLVVLVTHSLNVPLVVLDTSTQALKKLLSVFSIVERTAIRLASVKFHSSHGEGGIHKKDREEEIERSIIAEGEKESDGCGEEGWMRRGQERDYRME